MEIAIAVLVIQTTLLVMMVKHITRALQQSTKTQERIADSLEKLVNKSNEEK